MNVYIDSSFLVSLYLTDIHSSEARQRVRNFPGFGLTPLHRAEWAHALAQHQFRGNLTPEKALEMNSQFLSDEASGSWHEAAIPEGVLDLCADLGRRYGPKLGLRTLDSLHVACALELKAERFWTFDERQAKLARAVGIKTT